MGFAFYFIYHVDLIVLIAGVVDRIGLLLQRRRRRRIFYMRLVEELGQVCVEKYVESVLADWSVFE